MSDSLKIMGLLLGTTKILVLSHTASAQSSVAGGLALSATGQFWFQVLGKLDPYSNIPLKSYKQFGLGPHHPGETGENVGERGGLHRHTAW